MKKIRGIFLLLFFIITCLFSACNANLIPQNIVNYANFNIISTNSSNAQIVQSANNERYFSNLNSRNTQIQASRRNNNYLASNDAILTFNENKIYNIVPYSKTFLGIPKKCTSLLLFQVQPNAP